MGMVLVSLSNAQPDSVVFIAALNSPSVAPCGLISQMSGPFGSGRTRIFNLCPLLRNCYET